MKFENLIARTDGEQCLIEISFRIWEQFFHWQIYLPPSRTPQVLNLCFGKATGFPANFFSLNFINEGGDCSHVILRCQFYVVSYVFGHNSIAFPTQFRDQRSGSFAGASAGRRKIDDLSYRRIRFETLSQGFLILEEDGTHGNDKCQSSKKRGFC
jgi:hypothetical protein